jgi:isoleucyl-tRNA synthetase
MAFEPVSPQVDFVKLEKEILRRWYESGLVEKYLHKNDNSPDKFSFLDGPITANNAMGVHHAWSRTYKDVWQRYQTMKGKKQRYQNGFDCQGLWVEVEVEKELGFKTKKDIETYGVANFVNKCKERVIKYSGIQTEQSKQLGYFMDWDHSYFTMTDENNYAIWGFLKECWQRGWLYKGHDVVPWCPRCETAISQHEILTEDYRELVHESVYLELPITGRSNEYLLIWTTTPWTLPANTAVAVDPKLDYCLVTGTTGDKYWVAEDLAERVFKGESRLKAKPVKGRKLLGLKYTTPFDDLPAIRKALLDYPDKMHTVVATDPLLMPISIEEGTGLVHTSTSTGEEDFKLGKKLGLPVVPAIADNADYLEGFGKFTGLNAKNHPRIILDHLLEREKNGEDWVFAISPYKHRYPACWRCKTELVWKVADEWYISMDKPDPTEAKKLTYRRQMIRTAKKMKWLPGFGLDREIDWLKNMHDWLISKKNRYWGLALPIYECPKCGHFEVIGSRDELEKRAVSGWEKFTGNSPHKPWIDEVRIKCSKCQSVISRIADVGNPWLDAGIVATSTLPPDWFPADFITESFPGQFKNWFYSLIAMSTVLKKTYPARVVLGFATALDEKGLPMHKSAGNMIEFNDAAVNIGVDVMRWMFVTQNPENNLLFGYQKADEIRRRFHLMLWNIYNFFITYANVDNFQINSPPGKLTVLDEWILARLAQTVNTVSDSLDIYDAQKAGLSIQDFVSDLSLWYVRRSRDRVGPATEDESDKRACHYTLFNVLTTLSRLLAPFIPFLAEEIYKNLTGEESVHLADWPKSQRINTGDIALVRDMNLVRKIVELGLSGRKEAKVKVRQPLRSLCVNTQYPTLNSQLLQLIKDELNVKEVVWKKGNDLSVDLDLDLDSRLIAEGLLRDLIRRVQEERKKAGARLDQKIILTAPVPAEPELKSLLKTRTLSEELISGDSVSVKLL